jgi:hypothetical protein
MKTATINPPVSVNGLLRVARQTISVVCSLRERYE